VSMAECVHRMHKLRVVGFVALWLVWLLGLTWVSGGIVT
jgi:hypothetical protein